LLDAVLAGFFPVLLVHAIALGDGVRLLESLVLYDVRDAAFHVVRVGFSWIDTRHNEKCGVRSEEFGNVLRREASPWGWARPSPGRDAAFTRIPADSSNFNS
jgi:hypothetical protein